MKKRVIVLGGDGFCGWPTALGLSAAGHSVTIVDNLSRRRIEAELGAPSLTPIADIDFTISCGKEITCGTCSLQASSSALGEAAIGSIR